LPFVVFKLISFIYFELYNDLQFLSSKDASVFGPEYSAAKPAGAGLSGTILYRAKRRFANFW